MYVRMVDGEPHSGQWQGYELIMLRGVEEQKLFWLFSPAYGKTTRVTFCVCLKTSITNLNVTSTALRTGSGSQARLNALISHSPQANAGNIPSVPLSYANFTRWWCLALVCHRV